MPIYEYACPSCGHEFEQIVRLSAPAPACPECGGDEVDKKISLAAFHLKGGGWYSDAYAGSDNKKPGASESTAKPAAKEVSGTAGAGKEGAADKPSKPKADATPSPSVSKPSSTPSD